MDRKRRERDLDAELRAHLEMAAEDARARGVPPEAARLAALREFGNRDLVKETTRDIWGRNPFHGMGSDIRAGLRTFRKNPGFAAILVLTLALGIGANTAIFSLIDAVMLRSLPVSHPEQLVQVRMDAEDNLLTNPVWEQLRDRQNIFSGLFAYSEATFNLTAEGKRITHRQLGQRRLGDVALVVCIARPYERTSGGIETYELEKTRARSGCRASRPS